MKKLIYFSSTWCQPCIMFGPRLEQLTLLNKIPLQKFDVDKDKEMTIKYHIKSIPTVILINEEQELNRFVGIKSDNDILDFWKY